MPQFCENLSYTFEKTCRLGKFYVGVAILAKKVGFDHYPEETLGEGWIGIGLGANSDYTDGRLINTCDRACNPFSINVDVIG